MGMVDPAVNRAKCRSVHLVRCTLHDVLRLGVVGDWMIEGTLYRY